MIEQGEHMKNVYEKLQNKLDNMATGFPKTESKIEIRLLKQLFTETEAEIFIEMTPFLEKPEDAAYRLKREKNEVAQILETMAQKGLIFRLRKSGNVRYSAIPFVAGIFEYQVNRLNKEISRDIQKYYSEGFSRTIMAYKHPPMRTIPVDKKLIAEWPIAPYEDVEEIFDKQRKIALLNCVCRTWGRLVDNDCNKPLETCFYFGSQADYFVENKVGRYVEASEAKKIVKETLYKSGLVLQLSAGQKPSAVCMCCGDCCNMLLSLKKQPVPAKAAKSNYFANVDKKECVGCGECIERCQMEAIQVKNEKAIIDYKRCIGCGACTFGCSSEVITLERKSDKNIYTPPANIVEAYMDIAVERGIV
jgi:H+/Na+-translocating ferredoxin:NAD+ oxidoreductase subunit B